MKRVIEIDEKMYDKALHPKDYDMSVGEMYDVLEGVLNAVFNGTPLNDVLDEIGDEVKKVDAPRCRTYDAYFKGRREAVERVLEIIDKYKESEDE